MKQFVRSILVFSLFVLAVILSVFCLIDEMGWSDWAYKRFRTSGEKSLILGTSRAAQGILPSVINKSLDGMGLYLPIYNFSFTGTASPYGELYYKAVDKKIDKSSYKNGLFILSVDPWGLSINEEDKDVYREYNRCLAYVDVYMKPNFQYMFKYISPLSNDKSMTLHDDGWYELDIPMDSLELERRIDNKKKEYGNVTIEKSQYRLNWLAKTIQLLKSKGRVFLCRIPPSDYFVNLENRLWPDFDNDMNIVAKNNDVTYISLIHAHSLYRTIDGQHIYKEDGKIFTKELCDSIKARIK